MPLETSCMFSFKRVSMLYGENNDMFLCWEFHYESISTLLVRTKSLLSMGWLSIQHGKRWLQLSLVDQQVQLWNLMPLLKSTNIKGFMKGIILFQRSWRCITHSGMIWIVSLGDVFIFSTIDNQKVICFSFLHLIF
jgi:hypothetical protein